MTVTRSAAPHLDPTSRLQFLPKVGPARAGAFERLGLTSVEDLMRHYPRGYLDARRFVPIAEIAQTARAAPGGLLTVRGTIRSAAALRTRSGRSDFSLALSDGTGTIGCYFFGQSFLARTLRRGTEIVVSGEYDPFERRMTNPLFEVVEGDVADFLHVGRLIPIHRLTKGLHARAMRSAVRAALDAAAARLADPLPAEVTRERGLVSLARALEDIHFPKTDHDLAEARRRLAFEELFLLQSVLALRKRALGEHARGLASAGPGELAARAEQALPFELTPDQRTALREIVTDLRREHPMQRLLLGDVGSGKTVVALLAALHAIEAGHQVAFLAPTEILARQHAKTLARFGAAVGVQPALLIGATPAAERRLIASRLASGEPMLAVGTHALLEEKVPMPNLALAIVDEQHRFGVEQRAALAKKGVLPDVLVLTATPIPRTLTLAYFGDLDQSRLGARPAGRGRLVTRIAGEEKSPQVVEFMARELAAGRQVFVVVPLIEEGRQPHRNVEAEQKRLATHPLLSKYQVRLLHGKLKSDEKRAVMEGFAAGEVQVLVTTTVVEVGVDVPNATLMVIENAERMGLAQLHQLRGRVGRGEHRSVCVLVPGATAGARGVERLQVLVDTDDGFKIAEADLRMRGPGDLWGTRQSGLPSLRIANLATDEDLLDQAREAARKVVEQDPWLRSTAHQALEKTLRSNYREALELALAG